MVEQVVSAKRYLETVGDETPVTGVVFMGMGEPFDNYDRCVSMSKGGEEGEYSSVCHHGHAGFAL